MRIITGKYKGKHFEVPRSFKARPTTDFAKENRFNVLRAYVDFEETRALDLFAGTGSITLELLSRGCPEVVSVERDRQHYAFVRAAVEHCTAGDADVRVRVLNADALRIIAKSNDPPYALRELSELPERVMASGLLKPGALFVLEHGKEHDFSSRPEFLEHRAYGSVNFSFFRKPESAV